MRRTLTCLLVLAVLSSPVLSQAPLLDNLGDHHFPITTRSDSAQRYFDQGLILHYSFNHAEAARSFREAQRLDPDCAMAYWGEALTLGPHINAGMYGAAVDNAWQALTQARELAGNASERERAYIQALGARYEADPPTNRDNLDVAYADAMRELVRVYSDDPDAHTLLGEALMITTAWDYWQTDGQPKQITEEILGAFDAAIAIEPYHPGANHLLIHTVEMRHPERGVKSADRLAERAPDVGHILHMPSHIYLHLGRWAEASAANERAVAADRKYLNEHGGHGMYRISYMPHNPHYLWYTSSMEGRGQTCIDAARRTRELIVEDALFGPGYSSLSKQYPLPYFALARFGRWETLLQEPQPDNRLVWSNAAWHYTRGLAHLRLGRTDSARQALQTLHTFRTAEQLDAMEAFSTYTAERVMTIAVNILEAEVLAAEQDYSTAIDLLNEAITAESELGYHEPPVWYLPPRLVLGAILLKADRPAEARQVYEEDLEQHPNNGWALWGLYRSLNALGNEAAAETTLVKFNKAWSRADIELTDELVLP